MSASTIPTDSPRAARDAARFTVTDDLPTPPLPEATAYTLVNEPGSANGMRGSAASPRSWRRSAVRCSSLITSSCTRTSLTPSTPRTAAVTSLVIRSRIGQPATVSQTATDTTPPSPTETSLTMPSSVIGRRISGSCTPARAACTASGVGEIVVVGTSAMLRGGKRPATAPSAAGQPSAAGARPDGLPAHSLQLGAHEVAQEVAGDHLAEREPNRGQLPRQVLGVLLGPGGPRPVLLERDPVPVVLAVLGEQDEW